MAKGCHFTASLKCVHVYSKSALFKDANNVLLSLCIAGVLRLGVKVSVRTISWC